MTLNSKLTFFTVFRIIVVTETRLKVVRPYNRLGRREFKFTHSMSKIALCFHLARTICHVIFAQFCLVFLANEYLLILRCKLHQSAKCQFGALDNRSLRMREVTFVSFLAQTLSEMSAQFRIDFDLLLVYYLLLIFFVT